MKLKGPKVRKIRQPIPNRMLLYLNNLIHSVFLYIYTSNPMSFIYIINNPNGLRDLTFILRFQLQQFAGNRQRKICMRNSFTKIVLQNARIRENRENLADMWEFSWKGKSHKEEIKYDLVCGWRATFVFLVFS
jgi:hypothetical protein